MSGARALTRTLAAMFILLCTVQIGSADVSGRYVFEDVKYRYFVNVPPQGASGAPLIVALHGHGDTAMLFRETVQLDAGADLRGAVVLYPQALQDAVGQRSWNVEEGAGATSDLGFLLAAIHKLQRTYDLDSARIFLVGFSNGGSMAYRLACAEPERFAAIAVVAGAMTASDWLTCSAQNGVPALHIHGRDDDVVLLKGVPLEKVPSAFEVVARAASWNGAVRREASRSYSNGHVTRYFDEDDSLVGELVELSELGHDWPIGFGDRYYASDEIWTFFERVAPWRKPER